MSIDIAKIAVALEKVPSPTPAAKSVGEECARCDGTGIETGSNFPERDCPDCNGTGKAPEREGRS